MINNKKEEYMKFFVSIFTIMLFLFSPLHIRAETVLNNRITPEKSAIELKVEDFIDIFFDDLKNKRTEKIAWKIVEEVGYTWEEEKKEDIKNDYRAKLDSIFLEPPKGKYGDFYGHDLINYGYLPGSTRYVRSYYISYHTGAPLIWEFHFYLRPKGELSLTHISWSGKNAFDVFSYLDLIWEELKRNNELLNLILRTSR